MIISADECKTNDTIFCREEATIRDVSWVVTANTRQRDIAHQVDKVCLRLQHLCFHHSVNVSSRQVVAWRAG